MEKLRCSECKEELSDEMIDVNMCFACGCIIDKSLFDDTSYNEGKSKDEKEESAYSSGNDESDVKNYGDKSNIESDLNIKSREIEGEKILKCLRCNSKMHYVKTAKIQLGQTGYLLGDWSNLIAGSIQLEIYTCSNCGKVEFFQPSGYAEHEVDKIAQKRCPSCGTMHDIDYPKCPFCKYIYSED